MLLSRTILVLALPFLMAINVTAKSSVQLMACLINKERAKVGAFPLSINSGLTKAALTHSRLQAKFNTMSHNGFPGEASKFADRIRQNGVSFSSAAENIAAGQTNEVTVMRAWMNSPPHRANILNPRLTHFGSGFGRNSRGSLFWTQDFATVRGRRGTVVACP